MRGYWAIGRKNSAIPPIKVMTTDSTVAKIGRSIKNREIMTTASILGFSGCGAAGLARPAACGAASDCPASDGIGRASGLTCICARTCWIAPTTTQSSALDVPLHHAEAVFLQGPRLDAAGLGFILRVEHVNVLQALIGLDGPIDDQQRLVRLADRQPHAHEHAGRK